MQLSTKFTYQMALVSCKSSPLDLSVSNIPEFLGDRGSHWQLRSSTAFWNELSL